MVEIYRVVVIWIPEYFQKFFSISVNGAIILLQVLRLLQSLLITRYTDHMLACGNTNKMHFEYQIII